MFNLIIVLISVGLMALLAIVGISYIGDAFNKGSEKALASTLVNQAQQVQAADTLASFDGQELDITGLVTNNYLAASPVPPAQAVDTGVTAYTIDRTNGYISAALGNISVCQALAEQAGGAGAAPTAGTAPAADRQFDCFYDDVDTSGDLNAGDTMTFAYKN